MDADHFYDEMDLDEDLLDDEGMDDMFSVDLGERDIGVVPEVRQTTRVLSRDVIMSLIREKSRVGSL